ncbi:arylsulfatase [Carboxylicivirga sp. N1Y90]|uniref:arylsulfatase n=1 Tax=Carboxylicivirga fragile TaxID=3417571 RepID=UPI003D33F323|nr:arylsulfatase [Marinilabiliaceae bacterium N1Y90]
MEIKSLFFLLIVSVFISACNETEIDQKPNIIYILADDLGYGELGCYGQDKIETPNIDKLAAGGMLFTNHYSGAPVCAPSRCVLLTGLHTGHAIIRSNDEWADRGDVWSYDAMIEDSTLEGQRPMPDNTLTIAQLLKSAGYKTAMTGKWGLGAPQTNSTPTNMGFDFFCGYNCQRIAHTYYPVHLYKNNTRIYLGNDTVAPHEKLDVQSDPYAAESYERYNLQSYAPDRSFDEMMDFIASYEGEPFFWYWATPIPHMPLQAPQKWVNYYQNKFGDEEPYMGDKGYYPHRYPKAAYAAMISYLDEKVGELVQTLKENGTYDNTLIIFTSDNGPTYNGGTESEWFNSAGPFRSAYGYGKGFLHEGGIRVPMIASWPKKIKAGSQSDHISAFWDVLPTLCDISGTQIPADIDGISFLPTLLNNGDQKEHDYLYWEFPSYGGQQAVRMGPWKALRKNILKGNLDIELYNLDDDPQEKSNVAKHFPEVFNQMSKILREAHSEADNSKFRMKALGDSMGGVNNN